MRNELKVTILQSDLFWENPDANRRMFSEKINNIIENTDLIFEEIDNNLLMYRNIIATQIDRFDTDEQYKTDKQDEFIETVKLFSHLMPEEE